MSAESTSSSSFKEGTPSDPELDDLAGKIGQKWEKLGIRLGISQDVLDEIDVNAKDKPFELLLRWKKTKSSDTPYRELYDALCHRRVGLNILAKEFCCTAGSTQKKSLNKDGSSSRAQKRHKDTAQGTQKKSLKKDGSSSHAQKRRKVSPVVPKEEIEIVIRTGIPSGYELQKLSKEMPSCWKDLGRCLGIPDAKIIAFERQNPYDISEQAYQMLLHWEQSKASGATYKDLFEALCDEVVSQRELAEKYCCQ